MKIKDLSHTIEFDDEWINDDNTAPKQNSAELAGSATEKLHWRCGKCNDSGFVNIGPGHPKLKTLLDNHKCAGNTIVFGLWPE